MALALAEAGVAIQRWRRRARTGHTPLPWPEPTLAAAAALRLPKGRRALEMTLHAVLSRLEPGGRIWLYGHNAEGIRSAGSALEAVCDDVVSVETRKHSRVWTARRGAADLRGELGDWEERFTAELPGGDVELVSYPGLFAHGRLDAATALLCENLPRPAAGANVLDFGCGAGAISAALHQLAPDCALYGVDVDALALAAAERNVPGLRRLASDGFDGLPPDLRFAHVVSNPPFHAGVARDTGPIQALVAGAAARLEPGGSLHVVSQSTIPLERWLGAHLGGVRRLAATRSFHVFCGSKSR
ncbi:MAG: methyltransferase [Myxococcota bacterium]|nr:methyltransferase [Myxococcota bacterium]